MASPTVFHTSNLGSFGGDIPQDRSGYAYTTIAGWLAADIEWGDMNLVHRREWARERKAETITALAAAESGVAAWQGRS